MKQNLIAMLATLIVLASYSIAESAPIVFRVSDPIGPGETALLFGDGIGAGATAVGERVPDLPVTRPPDGAVAPITMSGATPLQVLASSEVSAKVVMPDGPVGMYAVRLTGKSGPTAPVLLNRTEVWWWMGAPGDAAEPGGTLRVFGKNLGPATKAWLASGAQAVALTPVSCAKYAATFTVPATVAPGAYKLWVHNGFGGAHGFAAPLDVNIRAAKPWPTTTFNVRDFGAKGDGVADDTAAIAQALAKAGAAGGGVVWLPKGRYLVSAKLTVPRFTVLRGEKREAVWIYVSRIPPAFDGLIAGSGDFAVENLSIVSQTTQHLIVCPDVPNMYTQRGRGYQPDPALDGRNVHLRHVRIQHLFWSHRITSKPGFSETAGPATVVLAGPDMEISDCDIVAAGMPLHLIRPHHSVIDGNRIGMGRGGFYLLSDVEQSVVTNNHFQALDLEGSGGGTHEATYNVYFAGNMYDDIFGADREALTFDSPYYAKWIGRVGTVSGSTIETAGKTWTPGELKGWACLILAGKGVGEYVPIVDNTATAITLASPLPVAPDATSTLDIRVNRANTVVTNCTFGDCSVAVQLYSECYGFIIDGNKSARNGGSYACSGDAILVKNSAVVRRCNTSMFNQWLNNDLDDGFVYQQGPFPNGIVGTIAGASKIQPPAFTAIGNIIRNNTARNGYTFGAFNGGRKDIDPDHVIGGLDTIIEGNTLIDTPLAIKVQSIYKDTLIRHNHFTGCDVAVSDFGMGTVSDVAIAGK